MTGQRRMLFPPWRLNLPLTFLEVVLDWVGDCSISVLCFFYGIFYFKHVRFFTHAIFNNGTKTIVKDLLRLLGD